MEFAGKKHRCDAEELELVNGAVSSAQVSVDKVDCSLHGLWVKLELDLDDQQPIDQYATVIYAQLLLRQEVVLSDLGLRSEKIFVDDLDVVFLGHLICLGHP